MDSTGKEVNVKDGAHEGDSKQDCSVDDGMSIDIKPPENGSPPPQQGKENMVGWPEVREDVKEQEPTIPPDRKQNTLSSPKGTKNAKSSWECNLCHYTTVKKSILLRHCKTAHTNVKDFNCNLCQYSTNTKMSILHHYKTAHTNMKDFKCDLCEYSTNWKKELQRHSKAVHLNIKEYKCDQCTKEFTQKGHMLSHKRMIHEGIKEYQCDKCSFGSNTRYKLEQHKREVHDQIKAHACEDCEFSTSIPSNLLKHKRVVHMNQCEKCDFACKEKRDMVRHLMTVHNENQKYKCDSCEFISSKTVHDLERHKKAVHHKIRDHICDCGFATARKSNLLRHKMVVHLNFKEFKCNACEFACSDKRVLKKHQMVHDIMDESHENNSVEAAGSLKKKIKEGQNSTSKIVGVNGTPENSDRSASKLQILGSPTPPLEDQRVRNLEAADYFRKMQAQWAMQNKDHKEAGVKLKMFRCSRCQFTAWSREDMTAHMMDMHAKRVGQSSGEEKQSSNNVAPYTSEHEDISDEAQMFPWILPDKQVEPVNQKEVAKESNAGIALVKLGKNMSVQKVPNVRIDAESSNMITIEKPSHEEPQKIWRVAAKGVIDHPWSLNGIEDKITSVGNWLDKIKGKK